MKALRGGWRLGVGGWSPPIPNLQPPQRQKSRTSLLWPSPRAQLSFRGGRVATVACRPGHRPQVIPRVQVEIEIAVEVGPAIEKRLDAEHDMTRVSDTLRERRPWRRKRLRDPVRRDGARHLRLVLGHGHDELRR